MDRLLKIQIHWETAANFRDADATLFEWQEEKMRRARGFKEPFDYDAWLEERKEIDDKRGRRHERRNKRRGQLGLPLTHHPNDDGSTGSAAMSMSDGESDDGVPLIQRLRAKKSDDDVPLVQRSRTKSFAARAGDSDNASPVRKRRQALPYYARSEEAPCSAFLSSSEEGNSSAYLVCDCCGEGPRKNCYWDS